MDAFNATVSGFDSRFATMDGIVKNKVDEGLSNGRAWLGEQASLITGIKQEHKEAMTDMLIAAGGLPEGLGKARKYVNSIGKRDPFTSQPQTAAGRPKGLGESAKEGGLEPNAMSESGASVARDLPESGGGTVADLPESGGTVADLPEGGGAAAAPRTTTQFSGPGTVADRFEEDPESYADDETKDFSGERVFSGGAQGGDYTASITPAPASTEPELFPEYAQGSGEGLFGSGTDASAVDLDAIRGGGGSLRMGMSGGIRRRGIRRQFGRFGDDVGNQEGQIPDYSPGQGVEDVDVSRGIAIPDDWRGADSNFYHGRSSGAAPARTEPPPSSDVAQPEVTSLQPAESAAESGASAVESGASAAESATSALEGGASAAESALQSGAASFSSALESASSAASAAASTATRAVGGLAEAGAKALSGGVSDALSGGAEVAEGAEAGAGLIEGATAAATAFGPLALAVGGVALGLEELFGGGEKEQTAPPQKQVASATASDVHGLTYATRTTISDAPAAYSAF